MKKIFLFWTLAGLTFSARADVTFTQSTTTTENPELYRVKISMKGSLRRVETIRGPDKFVVIEKAGVDHVILLNPKSKNYTTVDRTNVPFRLTNWVQGDGSVALEEESQNDSSISTATEKAFKIRATVSQPPFGGVRKSTILQIQTLNSTVPFPPATSAHDAFERAFPVELWRTMAAWKNYDGLVPQMRSAFDFVPLRTDVFIDGALFNSTLTSGISSRLLPSALFTVPAGYKSVTSKVWLKKILKLRK